MINGIFKNSEISLRDVALNFSPTGNITRIMRLRSLADFSTQIVLCTTSHNPDVVLLLCRLIDIYLFLYIRASMISYMITTLQAYGVSESLIAIIMVVCVLLVISCFIRQIIGISGYTVIYPIVISLLIYHYGLAILIMIWSWVVTSILTSLILRYIFVLEWIRYTLMTFFYLIIVLCVATLIPQSALMLLQREMISIHLIVVIMMHHIFSDMSKWSINTLYTAICLFAIIFVYILILRWQWLASILTTYPDVTVLMSIISILMIGRYTGLQVVELIRFYPLISHRFQNRDEEE